MLGMERARGEFKTERPANQQVAIRSAGYLGSNMPAAHLTHTGRLNATVGERRRERAVRSENKLMTTVITLLSFYHIIFWVFFFSIIHIKYNRILITGDFNPSDLMSREFLNLLDCIDFKQHVTQPTHSRTQPGLGHNLWPVSVCYCVF